MLWILSRRWLGVSGWVYLLALSLAAFMYWILPGSSAKHQWSFDGSIMIRGFSDDHKSLVVKREHKEDTTYLFLNLESGKAQTFDSGQVPDYNPLDFLAERQLTYTARYDLSDPTSIQVSQGSELIQPSQPDIVIDSLIKTMPKTTAERIERLELIERVLRARLGGLGLKNETVMQTVRAYGSITCIDNQQRMLLTKSDPPGWHQAWLWLKKKCKWKTDFDKDWNYFRVVLYDLTTGKLTETPIKLNHRPYFAMHPNGNGVAILDQSESTKKETSKLSWYNLPLDSASLTWMEWCFVIGAFVLTVALAMLHRLFHRLRRTQVVAPPHP